MHSHALRYNKTSMLLHPLGEGVQNVSRGPRLRQQRPVFCCCCCCCCSAPELVKGSTGAADGEEFQVSKGFFFLPFFYPAGSQQRQTRHMGVYVHLYCGCLLSQLELNLTRITKRPVCVCLCVSACVYFFLSYSGLRYSWMLCSQHHLIPPESVRQHSRACAFL